MHGKTAVGTWSAVLAAATVLTLLLGSVLQLTGVWAAVAWVPALAVMAGTITVTARTAGRSGTC